MKAIKMILMSMLLLHFLFSTQNLLCQLRYKALKVVEFNDEQTWDAIKQDISPFLEYIRTLRGLKSFSVEVGATEYELKAKICHVNVMLEPTPIIEKIMLNLYIK